MTTSANSENIASIITDRRRVLEIGAVFLTGTSKILFINILKLHAVYIVSAILFWSVYFAWRVKKHPDLLYYWGLSLRNAKGTFKIIGIAGGIATLSFIVYGLFNDSAIFSTNLLFVLVTYPFWGLIQQFMVMSILANNLNDFKTKKFSYYQVIFLTSFVFAIVHFPSIPLIIATFLMAVFYSVIFLKEQNIIPLGIFHGIMGGLFYYLVLGKDTWSILISILQR